MAWSLYQLGLAAAMGLVGPWLLLRKGRHYLPTLKGRLGIEYPAGQQGGLWIHAVSVGEVGVAATLVQALPPELPLLVTTITPTGQQRALTLFGERARVAYLPFDLGFAVERFLRRFEPAALVLVEGDYWPLLLSRARRRGLPVATVNGRVGDRSYARLCRLPRIARHLLEAVDRFGVQTAEDARRLTAMGVPSERVTVTGNLKYEAEAPALLENLESAVRELARGRPLLVAGSTMPGEEEQVIEAFRQAGGGAEALLILAPRHPERWDGVARAIGAAGFDLARRSDLPAALGPDILLLDSMGELAGLYRLADAVFIGGTLVPTGGHNPLEPARLGRAIAAGPSMDNFRDMAAQLDRAGAWHRVANASELGETWRRWLAEPEAAAEVGAAARLLVEANRGALERTLELLEPVLLAAAPSPSPLSAAAPGPGGAGAARVPG